MTYQELGRDDEIKPGDEWLMAGLGDQPKNWMPVGPSIGRTVAAQLKHPDNYAVRFRRPIYGGQNET